jgi:MEMO1 family protein
MRGCAMDVGAGQGRSGRRRPPAVAGLFYPGTADELSATVGRALESTRAAPDGRDLPKALIVPHAGYVYSAPIAAEAFARLRPAKGTIRRVVIAGPAHRVPVRGIAVPSVDAFDTPLGALAVDRDAIAAIAGMPGVVVSDAAHAEEHALEVQLPFLQVALGDVAIVPLCIGAAGASQVADVLERLWGGRETLVVVSSDLSHYLRYEDARAADAATARSILALAPEIGHEQACGATPIAGLLEVARRRGLSPELLDLRNSGDTAGDRRRVVGYASFAFYEEPRARDEFDDAHGRALLGLARASIREALGGRDAAAPRDAWLRVDGATFVTLRQRGELRGCIGSLVARRPLSEDVSENARAAALRDPRFPPLRADELGVTEIEVSLLSPPVDVPFEGVDDLFARITPGVDGVVLAAAGRHATFLPQVWEDLPSHEVFFAQLLRKAGLPSDFPLDRCQVQRYTVRKWTEARLGVSP